MKKPSLKDRMQADVGAILRQSDTASPRPASGLRPRKTINTQTRVSVKAAKRKPAKASAIIERLSLYVPSDVVDMLTAEKRRRKRAAGRFRGTGADYSSLVTAAVRKVYGGAK